MIKSKSKCILNGINFRKCIFDVGGFVFYYFGPILLFVCLFSILNFWPIRIFWWIP